MRGGGTMRKISLLLVLAMLVNCESAFAAFRQLEQDVYDKTEQNFTMLDLAPAANMGFADDIEGDGKGGWTDQGAVNDLSSFPYRGETSLCGVKFNIIDPDKNDGKSCIVLRGQNNMNFPTSAEIEVNKKAAGVYFLHASAWVSTVVGYYTFEYEDGSSQTVTVKGNQDVFNWWGKSSSERCIPAWTGKNQSTDQITIGMFACENPQPAKTIKKIVAHTDGDAAYLMIVAATLTDAGPYTYLVPDTVNPKNTDDWFAYTQPKTKDIKGTALDMSFLLDAPAGKHGFVHTEDSKMVFEDGTPFRYWGINIHSEMLFVSHDEAIDLADRIAAQGFNLIRIHQMDIINSGNHNIFGRSPKNSLELDEEQMDKMCFFLNELKKRGVYWFFDEITNKNSFEDDNIIDNGAVERGQKGQNFYDPRILELQKEFARQLFTWYNPYTGLKIADDPAFIMTDIVNENPFPDRPIPTSAYYKNELNTKFTEWLKTKYGTDSAIKAAWESDGKIGAAEGESLKNGYTYAKMTTATYSDARRADMFRFAMDTQTEFTEDMIKYLREQGVKAMITGSTSWTDVEAALFNMNSKTDFVDIHQYWLHPASGWAVTAGTKFSRLGSQLKDKNLGILGYMMNRGVYKKVHTVSEWNDCEPNPTGCESPILMAAYGRLHDWHPIAFAYSTYNEYRKLQRTPEECAIYEVLTILGNPNKNAGFPAAAFIYLSDAVKEADKGWYTLYRDENIYEMRKQLFSNDPALGMIGKSGVAYEADYDAAYNSDEVLRLAEQGRETGVYTSVTGEMTTDMTKSVFMLNTELAQAAVGYTGGERFETNDLIFDIDTEFSTDSVCALDKKPIEESERMLLTTLARQMNTGMKLARDGSKVEDGGTAPILIEPVCGSITIKNTNDYDVWILESSGQRNRKAKCEKTAEGYTKIILSAENRAMNYEIVKTGSGAKMGAKKATYTLGAAGAMFDDISDKETTDAAERLYFYGYARGTGERKFSPEQEITRGEFALWLMNALNPDTTGNKAAFEDVAEGSPINKIKALGVVGGERLDADKPLSAEDMYKITEGALKAVGRKNYSVQKEQTGGVVTRGRAAKLISDVLWK